MTSKNLKFSIDQDGVGIVEIDVADRSMNVFTPELAKELTSLFVEVKANPKVVGVIITSRKANGFMAGADLKDFVTAYDRGYTPAQASEVVAPIAASLRQIELCGKPVVAAINGLALGGGLELCLACHYRVMVDDPSIRIGLPEVTVGLLPGGGGTQRLPRLIGIPKALPLLLTGRHIDGAEAMHLGVVNALVDKAEILAHAKKWIMSNPEYMAPWDKKGFELPEGAGALAAHAFESFALGSAKIRQETQDNLPAPLAIISAVYEGTQLPIDQALRVENAYFGQLLSGPVARNLMRTTFINRGGARKLEGRPDGVEKTLVKKLGVLGAGMMGTGIAQVAARAGIGVVLLDRSIEGASNSKSKIVASLEKELKNGRISPEHLNSTLNRIQPTIHYPDLHGCDFVIEAVFEDREIKADAYESAIKGMGCLPAGFVMASNTSTLPVSGLADLWCEPEEFIGLHFFSPVDRMPVVEIIRGDKTSDHALARAMDLVAQLNKFPIVVNDSPGFYTSRIFCSYIDEAMAMLQEGINAALIENAARQCGFATSPLAVTDEVSLDLQARVIQQAAKDAIPENLLRMHARPVVELMVEIGRLGRKTGGGFYEFQPGQPKRLWEGLSKLFPHKADQPPVSDVKHRLLYIQALEAARCVEENVVLRPADADLGSIFALGYPAWTGGTLSFIDTLGIPAFVQESDRLASRYGERFRPSQWMRDRAATNTSFHATSTNV